MIWDPSPFEPAISDLQRIRDPFVGTSSGAYFFSISCFPCPQMICCIRLVCLNGAITRCRWLSSIRYDPNPRKECRLVYNARRNHQNSFSSHHSYHPLQYSSRSTISSVSPATIPTQPPYPFPLPPTGAQSPFNMPQSSCLCGANVISWDTPSAFNFRCHCLDERKLTGAAFALNILVPIDAPKIISGKLSIWGKIVQSGNTIFNHSCSQCGSLLYRTSTGYPGTIVIKAGCMDGEVDPFAAYIPNIEIFTRSRVPWISPVEGALQDSGDFSKESMTALGF
jgi:hypothetical protein